MRKLILSVVLITVSFSFATDVKKSEKTKKNAKKETVLPMMCRTSAAHDANGFVVAAGTCCTQVSSSATPTEQITAGIMLTLCAEEKVAKSLSDASN